MKKLAAFALALAVVSIPTAARAQVLDLGDGGAFVNAISPTTAGRAVGAFWDNPSADGVAGARNCNLGYFAVGTMSAGCQNQAPGTLANQGNFAGGTYWGNGSGNRAPAAFMFSGSYSYSLKLVGSIAGGTSEVGWFTLSGSTYTFNPLANFGAKIVNSTYAINPGQDWGLYIRNAFNPSTGGCKSNQYDCSNANGGFTGAPYQQFALMLQGRQGYGAKYLVGVEDNLLNVLPNGNFYDSDYQDYLIEISNTTAPEPMSMVLVATGLIGMAGAGFVRRRRERTRA